ncbi:MAG: aldose 1-epimerase, partial [Casimicrobiaceae bacterium]
RFRPVARGMPAFLTLTRAAARIVLAPETGGAIADFAWRGLPVLRPTSEAAAAAGEVRRHACYPLVPYSNRIANGELHFRGRTHQLDRNFGDHPHSIHGVGWQRPWQVVARDDASALLVCAHDPVGSRTAADTRAWPWPFRATQWFTLAADDAGATLRARLTVENTGAEAFPVGLGFHPFVPRDAGTVLGFDARGVWETDATSLPLRHTAIPAALCFEPARAIGTTVLDNAFTSWRGETTVFEPSTRRLTLLRGDTACSFFVCYVPAEQPFIAIEPVTQMTDAFNRAARGDADTGTRILEPGASFSCTMEIAARCLQ